MSVWWQQPLDKLSEAQRHLIRGFGVHVARTRMTRSCGLETTIYLSVELGFIICFLHFMHICHARHYSTLRNVHYRKRRRRALTCSAIDKVSVTVMPSIFIDDTRQTPDRGDGRTTGRLRRESMNTITVLLRWFSLRWWLLPTARYG